MNRILIIEDDPLVAMMVEECLEALGYEAAATVGEEAEALAKIAQGGFDAAIVDVYLTAGTPCDAIAEALSVRAVPFVIFTGGFVSAPAGCWKDRPTLIKPFTLDMIDSALSTLLNRAPRRC